MTARDDIFESEQPVETGEESPSKDTSQMPDKSALPSEKNFSLDLMFPDVLPTEVSLSARECSLLREALQNLLHALQMTDRSHSKRRLEELLRALNTVDHKPATVENTGIPVKAHQVQDYDLYFRINRITSDKPAFTLVRGLLQTAHAVMGLFCQIENLPEKQTQQQISGFISYIHLLARTFNLGELA